jgi:hypothetical protein
MTTQENQENRWRECLIDEYQKSQESPDYASYLVTLKALIDSEDNKLAVHLAMWSAFTNLANRHHQQSGEVLNDQEKIKQSAAFEGYSEILNSLVDSATDTVALTRAIEDASIEALIQYLKCRP